MGARLGGSPDVPPLGPAESVVPTTDHSSSSTLILIAITAQFLQAWPQICHVLSAFQAALPLFAGLL